MQIQPRKILQDVGSVALAARMTDTESVLMDCIFAQDQALPTDFFHAIAREQSKSQNPILYASENCYDA